MFTGIVDCTLVLIGDQLRTTSGKQAKLAMKEDRWGKVPADKSRGNDVIVINSKLIVLFGQI